MNYSLDPSLVCYNFCWTGIFNRPKLATAGGAPLCPKVVSQYLHLQVTTTTTRRTFLWKSNLFIISSKHGRRCVSSGTVRCTDRTSDHRSVTRTVINQWQYAGPVKRRRRILERNQEEWNDDDRQFGLEQWTLIYASSDELHRIRIRD